LKIIGFVGLPGSGKSVASDVAREMGLRVLVMGDVIRQEAAARSLEPSDENLGRVGTALRASEGPEAVARRILNRAGKEMIVVVDGLRSKAEADFFRASSEEFHLIRIVAPAESRIRWIESRGRSDDPCSPSATIASGGQMATAIKQRVDREMGWGMNGAMKEADLVLRNEGDLEQFMDSVRKLLKELAV
jgi:dephospho-CoA kinase